MKLIGIQRVDYTNKSGYHVLGYKLHTATPAKSDDAIGEISEGIFVSDPVFATCDHLAVGDSISVAYNKYGKVTGVSVVG